MAECKLINGVFSLFIQFCLGLTALFSLIIKWRCEYPRRTYKIWFFDISKQVIGQLYAHGLNLAIALYITNTLTVNDQCQWYLTNYLLDVIIGIFLSWICVRFCNYLSDTFGVIIPCFRMWKIGDYGEINKYDIIEKCDDNILENVYSVRCNYFTQLLIWIVIITLVKLIIFLTLILTLLHPLDSFGKWLVKPVYNYPHTELIMVMIIIPLILNTAQYIIQDNYLKKKITTPKEGLLLNPTNI